jgi:hypothetical protein
MEQHKVNVWFGIIMASLLRDSVIMYLYSQLEERYEADDDSRPAG